MPGGKSIASTSANQPKTVHVRRKPVEEAVTPDMPVTSIVKHLQWFRIGCLPLVIQKQSFHRISVPFLLYSLMMVVFNVYYWMEELTNWKNLGPFTAALVKVEWLANMVYLPLMLIMILVYRKDFDKTIKKFMRLQCLIGIHKYNMFVPVKMYTAIITALLLVYISKCAEFYFYLKGLENDGLGDSMVFWSVVAVTVWTIVYELATFSMLSYLVCCIGSCFEHLARTSFVRTEDVRRFILIYNHLLEVAASINRFNDVSVSTTVLVTFLALIKATSGILKNSEAYGGNDPILALVGVSLLITTAFQIIHVCHSASKQADKANSALVSHIVYQNENPNFDESYAMLHLCAKKHLSFKMCKSMIINYNLGMSMIAAYITYTIILFQIDIFSPPVPTAPANTTTAG